jgi:hypothetical protein
MNRLKIKMILAICLLIIASCKQPKPVNRGQTSEWQTQIDLGDIAGIADANYAADPSDPTAAATAAYLDSINGALRDMSNWTDDPISRPDEPASPGLAIGANGTSSLDPGKYWNCMQVVERWAAGVRRLADSLCVNAYISLARYKYLQKAAVTEIPPLSDSVFKKVTGRVLKLTTGTKNTLKSAKNGTAAHAAATTAFVNGIFRKAKETDVSLPDDVRTKLVEQNKVIDQLENQLKRPSTKWPAIDIVDEIGTTAADLKNAGLAEQYASMAKRKMDLPGSIQKLSTAIEELDLQFALAPGDRDRAEVKTSQSDLKARMAAEAAELEEIKRHYESLARNADLIREADLSSDVVEEILKEHHIYEAHEIRGQLELINAQLETPALEYLDGNSGLSKDVKSALTGTRLEDLPTQFDPGTLDKTGELKWIDGRPLTEADSGEIRKLLNTQKTISKAQGEMKGTLDQIRGQLGSIDDPDVAKLFSGITPASSTSAPPLAKLGDSIGTAASKTVNQGRRFGGVVLKVLGHPLVAGSLAVLDLGGRAFEMHSAARGDPYGNRRMGKLAYKSIGTGISVACLIGGPGTLAACGAAAVVEMGIDHVADKNYYQQTATTAVNEISLLAHCLKNETQEGCEDVVEAAGETMQRAAQVAQLVDNPAFNNEKLSELIEALQNDDTQKAAQLTQAMQQAVHEAGQKRTLGVHDKRASYSEIRYACRNEGGLTMGQAVFFRPEDIQQAKGGLIMGKVDNKDSKTVGIDSRNLCTKDPRAMVVNGHGQSLDAEVKDGAEWGTHTTINPNAPGTDGKTLAQDLQDQSTPRGVCTAYNEFKADSDFRGHAATNCKTLAATLIGKGEADEGYTCERSPLQVGCKCWYVRKVEFRGATQRECKDVLGGSSWCPDAGGACIDMR